uniref:DNA-dependent protein kinase catalytic subunit n=1 Tax=Terrapene triunguis TaxID=2587831 RepID=A0A674JBQ4_9SAUR
FEIMLASFCLMLLFALPTALQTSLVFSKDNGLLVFVRKSLSMEEFRECREEALKFLCAFLEKIGQQVHPYAHDIKQTCISVYTKEKAAKCKIPALELLIKLLQNLRSSFLMEELKVGDIFNKFYGELAARSKVPDTVLEKLYELLGVLGEVQPSDMVDNSEKLFRAFLGELKTQMTSATREPKLPVVAGCLKGLTALMYNFTKSMDEDPHTSKEIFDFAVKAINPQVECLSIFQVSGLQLFSMHAAQFGTFLLDNYISLFEVLSKWCGHTNAELKKGGHSALDSFLRQISLMVAKDAEMHKSKLRFFMEKFYDIIRKMDSSNKELSIAIRGYGLFAAPCKAINSKDVDFMYVELLQRCKQMYLTEAETADEHVYQLPSFLQSIASVIFHIDTIPEVYTPVLERLIVVQIDSFPQYSVKMQSACCKSIVKVFLALAGKGPVLWSFISTVGEYLFKNINILICFSKLEESTTAGEVRTGKWKVPTYKDYLDLFRSLLNCDTMKESVLADETFLIANAPLLSLNRLLYDELIKSILKIIEKLDLTVQKLNVSEQDENEAGSALVVPTSDPASNLQPTKPKDFIAFINLVEFCREILPEKHVEFFEPWMYSFGYELIIQSTRLPLISGFYKLLSVAMKIAKKIKYFEGVSPKSYQKCPDDPEKTSCFALFAKFGKEVTAKMKQYKDELLASCLTFVLSLPHDIIMLDIKAYIPALQNAFKLGLSYTPMADEGLDALEDWSAHIPKHIMQPYYKDVLPLFDGYLKTTGSADESQNNWEVRKLSRAAQKGFNKVVIQRLKKAKTLSLEDHLSLEAVRTRVVRLLGSLGGQINRNLLTAASAEEMMKKFVSWDTEKHLSFAVPFADMKPVIYLDLFLPRVTELALSASDRQTKVAACELLHSIVMYMLGKASQMPDGPTGSPPMYQLYKRMFPVLLRLACDVDQVTRQLYELLVMELIHWFTNNKKFESQDTVALLEAILDGIVDPVDSSLRDFCGQCVREFMKWSIKQTTPQQQEKSPVNTKSLFKRLYSLALHPNALKRLGAALAFNNIYREFREENSLVEQFVFEVLVVYLESLALTHTDEKSLGTVQQCCDAIDHLKRIIKHKASSLNKAEKRRIPRGFPNAKSVCLLDLVMWLLVQCGRPQTECRHKSMELFYEFVPLLPGNQSPSLWLGDLLKKQGISFLINKFEGGGNDGDNLSGILSQPTLCDMQEPFSLRAVVQWMDMFLAALDCYNTFIEQGMIKPNEILGTKMRSSFLRAVEFFLKTIVLHDISAAERCFDTGSKGNMFSPQEREEYNYSKCTIIVRIMAFVSMILETCQQDFWKLLEKELLNANLIELLGRIVCDPANIGFNTADVQVMKNLPDVSVRLIKALMKSPYKESLELSIKERITSQSIEELCSVELYNPDARFDHVRLSSILSACRQLHKAGLLHSTLQSQGSGLHFTVGSKLLSVVYKSIAPGDERKSLPSLDISSKRLADGLLQLAFAFGGQCEELVSLLLNTMMLSVPLSGTSQRSLISFSHGEYFYSLFSETINQELLKDLDVAILQLMKSSVDSPKMVGTILNGMLDQSFRERAVRKQQGMKLVTAVLRNWMRLDSWWAKDSAPESKMAVLTLLAKVLQIDSSVSFNTNHEAFSAVFNTYTSLLIDRNLGLNLKSQAVIILPFFTNLTGERISELKNALDQLVAFNFPMKSDEFPKGTLRYNNYVDCTKKFLDALELSQSPMLLQLMTEILCRDHRHFMEDLFQTSFKRISRRSSCEKQVVLLDTVHKMFQSEALLSNATRQAFVDRSFLTLLLHCSLDALKDFFSKIVLVAMDTLKTRFTKSNEPAFDTQVTKKMGYYKILEVMYSRLSKEDIYSKDSRINQAYQGSTNVEGNELTKTLIKSCYDAFTENMAGESQLLEKRRQYHCAAYNCAIAVISCVFTESKFYQGFLFTEKPEKVRFNEEATVMSKVSLFIQNITTFNHHWDSGVCYTENLKIGYEILANRLLEFLMKNVFHQKRAVFRHNLEIIKTVVECWKDCLSIPYRLIFEQFSGGDPNTKDNSVGIQLLGIVLANNLSPHDPKCEIDSVRYFQDLANNMSLIRYKEVYAAAAEVLGLILRYMAEKENIFEGPVYDCVIKQIKQHQSTKEDKFIVCLNKVAKNFPPLADRFMNAVFFLIPKLHGVLKTYCLEVVMYRAEEIIDLYLQLKSKDFIQVMSHRDDERQRVCLDIIYKMLPKLKPLELRELLPGVTGFISHPSPVCRERMYDILMWIYDNYRDPESQAEEESQEVFKLAKEMLLQGLMDENSGLQLIVRNFWSDETRLPTNTLDRMLALLNSLYSTKIETQYLSLATNFLLEMTSKSPDYSRKMFEHPLSECRFQDFAIDSNWRYRSTVLTPMFVETQATQSAKRNRSQEGSLSTPGSLGGQVRATQQQYEFTPTQNVNGRSSFNWLTGSSIDTLAEYTVPSSSESLSSSMLFVSKRSEKSQRATLKPLGPNFGKKRLGLPGDEVDSKAKGINTLLMQCQCNIYLYIYLFLVKEKLTLYASDMGGRQATVSGYLQIQECIATSEVWASQLIFHTHSGEHTSHFQKCCIKKYFEIYQHRELLDLDSATVSTSCLASLQQPVGILLLEQALTRLSSEEEPLSKRMRGRAELSPDVIRWIELAKLYRSVGDYDVLRGIFSGKIGTKEITQNALLAEARSDYAEAAKQYDEALSKQDWSDGEPTEAEKDFWELASLECYNHLTEWKSLEYCSTVNIDSGQPPDLNKTWNDPFYQETYLPYIIRSKLKLLLHGGNDQSLLTFIDEAMKIEQRKALIEMYYSQELSLLYILQDDFDRARYYISSGMQTFMQNYSSIDTLLHQSRLTKLQSVQALTEIQEFINFISKPSSLASQASLKRLLRIWTSRYPDDKMDPMNIWDDIITNRCFFLGKIQEKLPNIQADDSMEVDGRGDVGDKMETDMQEEDIHSMIRSCKFNMKMKMIESARKQNSFSVAMKLLKDLHRESKTREDWLLRWNHSYCRFSHSRSQSQNSPEQMLTVLKTISLLDESKSDYLSKNIVAFRNQNLLLGTTYHILASALSKDPGCLEKIEEEKARKVVMLSGERPENSEKVIAGLNKKAFQYFSTAVRKAEEEVQSHSVEHVDLTGVIDAYMTLVDFCDKHLRKEEEGSSDVSALDLQTFPAIVVEKMIKALKLNSRDARLKFPRLLQIIERYPAETLGLMAREISSVPCWQFIGWISQLMAVLDKEEAVAVQHTVEEIANSYPQAIVYPFLISSENYSFKDTATGHKNKEFVARIKSKLDRGGVIQDFVHALEQLSNPVMLFKDWVEDVKNELGKTQRNKNNLKEMYEGMYRNLGDLQAPGLGLFRKRFIQTFGKDFSSHFGKGGSKLFDMKADDFSRIAFSLLSKMKDQKEPGNLKECSPWMSDFKAEFMRNELEIPGQYDGKGKPLPEYHAKISGFDERIKVMESIRKPKRINIRGSDEREHPFLVKGGEDLRQDQRIEELFDVMNIILSQDAACSQRNMQIKTYKVIPMTTRLGLIEWLENTCTLKNFLMESMTEEEKDDYHSRKGPRIMYSDWLSKMAGKENGIARYKTMYSRANRTETVVSFRNRETSVPGDLLRRAFVKMSTAPEAFLSLRSHFASSHALMCISHWILGIGDRHLSNFMINMETGGMVGIDFGHAFGSATQFLQVPELMPFRLTRQFINLMLPMKESGLIYSVMVHSLRAYRTEPDLLVSTMDVFVKEPSLDWQNFELKQLKKGGTWSKEVNTAEINWYPLQKVNCAKRKLAGANPAVLTCDELRLGHEKSPAYKEYVAVAQGSRDHNIRAKEPEDGLLEEIQVRCLLDQATDPNLLGRVWEGWEPWM